MSVVRRAGAIVVALFFLGLIAGLVVAITRHRWRILAAGLPDVAVWGWFAVSLWLATRRDDASAVPASSGADPGWPANLVVAVKLLPGVFRRPDSTRQSADLLLAMRALTLVAAASVLLFAGEIGRLDQLPNDQFPNGPVVPWIPVLAGVAALSILGARLAPAKRLDCSSNAKLAVTYRTRFMLRVAFAMSIALYAFTFTFIGGPVWTYYPAAAVTLAVLWSTVAPTQAALGRDQRRLQVAGCELSLVAALTAPNAYDLT